MLPSQREPNTKTSYRLFQFCRAWIITRGLRLLILSKNRHMDLEIPSSQKVKKVTSFSSLLADKQLLQKHSTRDKHHRKSCNTRMEITSESLPFSRVESERQMWLPKLSSRLLQSIETHLRDSSDHLMKYSSVTWRHTHTILQR